ncbi:MAG: hypothetical protein N3E38_01235 [Candidatus Aenigmarchaeota archaeon]|nr:hypothetical protein [Candidatus Aenigmarchaeota archaeon]
MRVLISNEKRFEKIKLKIKKDGLSKLHVVSDFDRTLTYGKVNGRKIPSLISILRDENYLSEEYSKKAKELFEKYHPTETDTSIDVKEKKKLMQKWWEEHYKILIEYF